MGIWNTIRTLGARKAVPGGDEGSDPSWWRDADALALAPEAAGIDRLEASATATAAAIDERERRDEMIDGLRRLAVLAQAPDLPVIATQHRVIGTDLCHLVAPASLGEEGGGAGKVFVTPTRIVLVGGPQVIARPWHRVHDAIRAGRDVLLASRGGTDSLQIRCNTYGDAIILAHLARRLMPPPAK